MNLKIFFADYFPSSARKINFSGFFANGIFVADLLIQSYNKSMQAWLLHFLGRNLARVRVFFPSLCHDFLRETGSLGQIKGFHSWNNAGRGLWHYMCEESLSVEKKLESKEPKKWLVAFFFSSNTELRAFFALE